MTVAMVIVKWNYNDEHFMLYDELDTSLMEVRDYCGHPHEYSSKAVFDAEELHYYVTEETLPLKVDYDQVVSTMEEWFKWADRNLSWWNNLQPARQEEADKYALEWYDKFH